MGGSSFRNILPFIVPKRYLKEVCYQEWERKFGEKSKLELMHMEPALRPIFLEKIVAINDKVQKLIDAQTYEKKNHVSVDMVTRKIVIHLTKD